MLKPLFARVLLKREKLKTSSIIIPDAAARRNAPARGTVVAVGSTADESIKALIGKTVIFGQHAGAWLNENGTPTAKDEEGEFFVCQDEDIIAEVTNDRGERTANAA